MRISTLRASSTGPKGAARLAWTDQKNAPDLHAKRQVPHKEETRQLAICGPLRLIRGPAKVIDSRFALRKLRPANFLSFRTQREEHELSSWPIGRPADLFHHIPVGDQRCLNLVT